MAVRKLKAHEIQWIIDDVFNSIAIDESLKKVEFNRREWSEFLSENPEVKKKWEQAQIDACPFLENDLLNIHRKAAGNAQMATIVSNNIMKVLAARKPDKYGNKIDLNVNQNISIRHNLESANERIANVMREVTPALVLEKKK